MEKKLSIFKYQYGKDKYTVIDFCYSDKKEKKTFFPKNNKINIEAINLLAKAINERYTIEFINKGE